MRHRPRLRGPVTALAALALLVAGCGGQDPTVTGPPDVPDGDDAVELPEEDAEVDAELAEEVQAAVADLAEETGTDPGDVEVVATERVTWPDGARGCPQPDQMYTMALVEGYRVVLRVDGDEVAYHGATGERPFRCDDPQAPVDG